MINELLKWMKDNILKILLAVVALVGGIFVYRVINGCKQMSLYSSVGFKSAEFENLIDKSMQLQANFDIKDDKLVLRDKKLSCIKTNYHIAKSNTEACNEVSSGKVKASLINGVIPSDCTKVKAIKLPQYNIIMYSAEDDAKTIGILNAYKDIISKEMVNNSEVLYFNTKEELLSSFNNNTIDSFVEMDSNLFAQDLVDVKHQTILYAPEIIYCDDNMRQYIITTLNNADYEAYMQEAESKCKNDKCAISTCKGDECKVLDTKTSNKEDEKSEKSSKSSEKSKKMKDKLEALKKKLNKK